MRIFVTGGSGFIGTALMDYLLRDGMTVVNFDCAPPHDPAHRPRWRRGDILDAADLSAALHEFEATHVVHLAARAELDESGSVADFPQNTDGVSNLLTAVRNAPTVARLIVTSTQMVCQPGYWPEHDEDYAPDSVYGQSKIITEQLTRQANLDCVWTIIRPTNIWGPWHPRHSFQFFSLLERGVYWHPRGRSARRCWGYVGNVAYQIRRILELPAAEVDRQTLYVGDAPFDLVNWVDAAAIRLTGRRAKTAPRSILYLVALAGELAQRCGLKAPLSILRYRAMTDDYLTPIQRTLDLVGPAPYSMEQGIEETLRWRKTVVEGSGAAVAIQVGASLESEQEAIVAESTCAMGLGDTISYESESRAIAPAELSHK
jgi:nucleoside-diphosphate-sugar epimerase